MRDTPRASRCPVGLSSERICCSTGERDALDAEQGLEHPFVDRAGFLQDVGVDRHSSLQCRLSAIDLDDLLARLDHNPVERLALILLRQIQGGELRRRQCNTRDRADTALLLTELLIGKGLVAQVDAEIATALV